MVMSNHLLLETFELVVVVLDRLKQKIPFLFSLSLQAASTFLFSLTNSVVLT